MQIQWNKLENEGFIVKDTIIQGDICTLVIPQHIGINWNIGINWTEENKCFRSSIWRKDDFYPVSLGFKKFVNLEERPDFEIPNLKTFSAIQKLDGSLAIISMYKKQLIFRTRGTFDARNLDNGNEVDLLISKYPKLFQSELLQSEKVSILCEWTTPNNVIVIRETEEPELWLVNIVNHENYTYFKQDELDKIAIEWDIKRPNRYKFSTIDVLKDEVSQFKGVEGVVIYCNNDQILKKVKGLDYLKKHAFKSECSLKNIIELFLQYNKPSSEEFITIIEKQFDYECSQMCLPYISKVYDAYESVLGLLEFIKRFVDPLKAITRKEAAQKIMTTTFTRLEQSCAFKLLEKSEIPDRMVKQLIYQMLGEA